MLSTIQSEVLGIEENGQILSRGLEVLVKKRWKNLNSAISYHLSYLDVQFIHLEDDFFPANNDQRHNFSWINYYHIKNWSFGLQYYFRSGLPYTEINGIELVEDDEEEYYELTFDMFNSQRLGNFHRLDASLSYSRPINHRA